MYMLLYLTLEKKCFGGFLIDDLFLNSYYVTFCQLGTRRWSNDNVRLVYLD